MPFENKTDVCLVGREGGKEGGEGGREGRREGVWRVSKEPWNLSKQKRSRTGSC